MRSSPLQVLAMPQLEPGEAVSPRGLGTPGSPSCPQSSPRFGWSRCGSGTSPGDRCWPPSEQPGRLRSELEEETVGELFSQCLSLQDSREPQCHAAQDRGS